MRLSSIPLALAALSLLSFSFDLAAVPQQCQPVALACASQCCSSVRGSFAGTICSFDPSYEGDYNSCLNEQCRTQTLQCLAPGSKCDQQYINCNANCGGDAFCIKTCYESALACAQQASSQGSAAGAGTAVPSASSGAPAAQTQAPAGFPCCIASAIIPAGLALALFARKK